MKKITLQATPIVKNLRIEIPRDEFALLFKTWRIERGLTQRAAAKLFGCSRYTIMRIENKTPISWEMSYKVYAQLSSELIEENKNK